MDGAKAAVYLILWRYDPVTLIERRILVHHALLGAALVDCTAECDSHRACNVTSHLSLTL